MSDEISDLRLFTRMVAAGSLSETARRLNTSLTAMSRRLSQIEERLGVRLVERGARGFKLSEEGELLFSRASSIIAEIDELEAEVTQKVRSPKGRLRVSAPSEIGRRRIAPLVADFTHQYSDIGIELSLTDERVDVLADRLDVSFQTDLPSDGNVIARSVMTSQRVVCAAPAYLASRPCPEVPADLVGHDCIRLVRWGHVYDEWRFMMDGEPHHVRVTGCLTTNSADVLHAWALAGRGIGLKARWDIQHELDDGRLVELLTPYAHDEINLYAVYASRNHLPLRIRLFIDHVAAGLITAPY